MVTPGTPDLAIGDRSPRCAPPAAARCSSAAGSATNCSAAAEGSRSRGLRHPGRRSARAARAASAASTPSARASRSTKSATSTSSLPRRESKTGRGHKGFTVEGDPDLSFEDAARRRDFTINAISRDPLTGEILDPFDGRARSRGAPPARRRSGDVSATTACACCARLQFAARFELTVDDETRAILRVDPARRSAARTGLGRSREAAPAGPRPSIGLALALDLGVVDRLWPELHALVGCPQEPEWHPEGDVWVHTLMVVDEARDADRRPRSRAGGRR